MPDFGIGELIAAIGGDTILEALGIGGAEAATAGAGAAEVAGAAGAAEAGAAGLETGLGTIGAGAGGAATTGGGIADIVGTGAGLFGGTTGLEGTAIAGGTDLASILGGGAGASALGTAADFVANPGASGFNAGAVTPSASAFNPATASPTAFGGAQSIGDAAALPANASPTSGTGLNVFDSGGTSPISNVNAAGGVSTTGAPSAVPAGASASSLAAPASVNAPVDATSVAGATGAATPTAGAAAPAAQSSSIESLLGKAGNGVVNSVTNNPLGLALGAGGLAFNVLNGQKQTANQSALSGAAQTAANTGQQALNAGLPIAQANNTTGQGLIQGGEAMQTYLQTGQLPPQYSQQIDQAINDAKTRAISNAAGQGQPTDPTKNTSLAATLAGIDNQRAQMTTQVAQTLFNAGGSNISAGAGLTGNSASSLLGAGQNASGLSAGLYQTLVQNDTTQAANTGKAIATLAAALNSGGKTPGTTTTPTG